MSGTELAAGFFGRPALTRKRIILALVLAALTDALQLSLGPFGWIFIDQGLDVIAMLLISSILGFHTLLLPTFLLEFIPGPDMLPTWTGCTAAVILLRKRSKPSTAPTIEVTSEVTPVPPDAQPAAPPRIASTVAQEAKKTEP